MLESFIFHLRDVYPALALHGCVIVALRRADKLIVPNGSIELQMNDVLTILGSEAAIDEARAKLDGAQ